MGKFNNDPKFIESQINLAKSRKNQVEKSTNLSHSLKIKQMQKYEMEISSLEKKLQTLKSNN